MTRISLQYKNINHFLKIHSHSDFLSEYIRDRELISVQSRCTCMLASKKKDKI